MRKTYEILFAGVLVTVFIFSVAETVTYRATTRATNEIRQRLIKEGWQRVDARPGETVECRIPSCKDCPTFTFRNPGEEIPR